LFFGANVNAKLSIMALRKFSATSGFCCKNALETIAD